MNKKVEDLEEAVLLRNKAVAVASRCVSPSFATGTAEDATPNTPWSRRADTDGPDPALWALASGHEAAGVAEQVESWSAHGGRGYGADAIAAGAGASGVAGGLRQGSTAGRIGREGERPRRVRLRTRLGKRCRKDLAAGRAGILIKATFNPLEGDSTGAKVSARCKRQAVV